MKKSSLFVIIVIILISIFLILSHEKELAQADKLNKNIAVLNRANEVIKEVSDELKLQEQNKAFGDLMFGDSFQTVVSKLQNDSSLQVTYPSSDGGVSAKFKVGETTIFLNPDFYQGGLYKVELNGMIYDSPYYTSSARRDYEILVKLVQEKYGAPDKISYKSTIWVCGKKTIMVYLRSITATCWIYDNSIEDQIRQKEENVIKEKSSHF